MQIVKVLAVLLMLIGTGCGGGGGGGGGSTGGSGAGNPAPPPPPSDPVTGAEAFQFLNQATFGATPAEVNRVVDMGIEPWIDDQLTRTPSLQLPHLQSLPEPVNMVDLQPDRVDIWFRNALHGDDQLRQRVAFALSEIMVVSQQGALNDGTFALADYYDILAENAFGNYRDLIEVVTLHPAMGVYLSMLGNEKPDTARNIRPDENYARELMQLFSIGLVELNIDGTEVLDNGGQPVPTYNQAVIEGFAHVFTGWHFDSPFGFEFAFPTPENIVMPMRLYPAYHDNGSKLLLGGEVIPAGQGGEADLDAALDNIFNHPNVGPFMAIRLIQRLVTSNPSPAYIARVAGVFNDNGSGVRGDLGAVVKAILMDPEARPETPTDSSGKLKEPLLRVTQLWRNYDAQSESGRYPVIAAFVVFGQGPLQSPSVFNFFSPFYAPPGEIRDAGLVAPELQIATEYQNTVLTNLILFQAFGLNQANPNLDPDDIYIDISDEMALAEDVDGLIDLVAEKLLGGTISTTLREELARMLELIPVEEPLLRAAEAVYFVASSPEYAYQN